MSDPPPLRVWTCGRTVTGPVRRNNEDNLWLAKVGDPEARAGDREASGSSAFPGVLLAVADGMGGAKAGEVASRMAVETLSAELTRRVEGGLATAREWREAARGAVVAAHERIRDDAAGDLTREGMGTTLTVAWILGRCVEVFQVGDSRAYVHHAGRLRQVTRDQSLVTKLVEDGILTEEEAERIPGRHIILQALGSLEDLDVVHESVALEDGDVVLLCTDGLSGLVKHADIESVLKKGGPLADQVDRLVKLAETAGGTDNITVVLARAGS
ncbi:MAG TPA: protein phosphatase 2C domain-containing protein [Planctomycetota bacterium]|nr:protein phosphatase 2C domain-containing protein [Planctomycetota bacterium]